MMKIINYIVDSFQCLSFGRMFNWILKHKEELPLSDEEKAMFIERNRKFIGIDTSTFRSLKSYWRENKKKQDTKMQ